LNHEFFGAKIVQNNTTSPISNGPTLRERPPSLIVERQNQAM